MKRFWCFAPLCVLAFASLASAGWHHRHAYAYPGYYAAPVYAPAAFAMPQVVQSAPQAGLGMGFGDLLLSRLLERVLGGIDGGFDGSGFGGGGGSGDLSGVEKDLADLKASLKVLDGRVDNVAAGMQKQGEGISQIAKDLAELRKAVENNGKDNKVALEAILDKMDDRMIDEAIRTLDDTTFKTQFATMLKAPTDLDKALTSVKDQLKKAKASKP